MKNESPLFVDEKKNLREKKREKKYQEILPKAHLCVLCTFTIFGEKKICDLCFFFAFFRFENKSTFCRDNYLYLSFVTLRSNISFVKKTFVVKLTSTTTQQDDDFLHVSSDDDDDVVVVVVV